MTLKKSGVFGVVFFLLSFAAWAVKDSSIDRMAEFKPFAIIKGFYVGPTVGANKVTNDVVNKVTAFRKVSLDWDFPALSAGQVFCAESATATLTGAKSGDLCVTSSNFGMDAGVYGALNVLLSCRALTDGVVFKACSFTTDAGIPAVDLPDGGYMGWTLSTTAQ